MTGYIQPFLWETGVLKSGTITFRGKKDDSVGLDPSAHYPNPITFSLFSFRDPHVPDFRQKNSHGIVSPVLLVVQLHGVGAVTEVWVHVGSNVLFNNRSERLDSLTCVSWSVPCITSWKECIVPIAA
jgi:hypothetical protein